MLTDLNALQGSPAAAPERIAPAAEAEAPENTETATRGAFTVETSRTAAPALDAEKTEGTVGVFGREPERAEIKPQKKTPGKTGKPGSKKLDWFGTIHSILGTIHSILGTIRTIFSTIFETIIRHAAIIGILLYLLCAAVVYYILWKAGMRW